jgi:hypothetical protein
MDAYAYDQLALCRQRELAAAKTGSELEQLHKRYDAEDRARQAVETQASYTPNGELHDLRRTNGHLANRVVELEYVVDLMLKKDRGIFANILGRIETLEQRPVVKYCGVYDQAKAYVPGNMVTHNGSIWHCASACEGQKPPGPSWTLAVKRGKDASPPQRSEPVVR